ncbi:WS/DGAT domain-containing protein, partial [Parvibaculum sp.]|uniref:WS/DGAT domain-containing protein n=1 Tax=Parvibaculum sp. TaxID=2024848 RepID=UPI002CB47EBF
ALNITVTSYADELDFGLLAAREAMPDLNKLADYIGMACDEIELADETSLAVAAEIARQRLAERQAAKQTASAPARKPRKQAAPNSAKSHAQGQTIPARRAVPE